MAHASDGLDITTPHFDEFIASQQKDVAFFSKQARLAAEEARLKSKREGSDNGGYGGSEDGNGGNRGNREKAKAKAKV